MNCVSVNITNFGIQWDDRFVASLIPKAMQEQIDEAEATLEASTPGNYPESELLNPAMLIATHAELDFKRLTELVNEPSDKPVLVVRLPSGVWAWPGGIPHNYYILDGHHRVVSAKLRGVLVKALVVGDV
jgi:hypothetical protein